MGQGNHKKHQNYFNQTQHVKINSQKQQKTSKFASIIFNTVIQGLRITQTIIVWILVIKNENPLINLAGTGPALSDSIMYQITYFTLLALKVLAFSIFFLKNNQKQNLLFQKLLKAKTLIQSQYKQIDLCITGFLLCINWEQNIFPFFLSVLLQIHDVVIVQNYIVRKALNYVSNYQSYYIYRAIVLAFLILNAINIHLRNILVFQATFLLVVSVYSLWFFLSGWKIFKRDSMNLLLNIQVAVYIAISYSIVEDIAIITSTFRVSSLFEIFGITLAVLTVCQLQRQSQRYMLFQYPQPTIQNLKEYDLMITNALEKINDLPQFNALLSGKLAYNNANSPQLQIKSVGKFYNRSSESLAKDNPENHLKQRLAKDHIQQCYEQELQKNSYDKTLLLQYCEFLYNQHGSIYRLIVILNILQLKNLNPIEKATVFKYRYLIQNTFKKINGFLYEGRLRFESIIECQQNISGLYDSIGKYLKNYNQIWDNFSQTEVKVGFILEDFQENLHLLKQIDQHWSKISQFFYDNKYWKRLYFNYLLFIKNDRIRQKELNDLKEYDAGKQSLKIATKSTAISTKVQTFNPAILFSKNVAYIKAIYHDRQLIIKNVSHNFEYLTDFEESQLKDCNIEALMPRQIRKKHEEIVSKWMIKGELVNQSRYEMKEAQLVVKDGGTRNVIKLFKTCFSIQSGLSFVCFLKFEDRSIDTVSSERFFDYHEYFSKLPTSSDDATGKFFFSKGPSGINQTQQSNIFIKQQSMECPQQSRQINWIKRASRFLCALTTVLLIIALGILNTNCSSLIEHTGQFVNYMYIYRYPIVLNMNYMRTFLNLGNQTIAENAIFSNTKDLIATASNELTLKSLYDKNLNPLSTYFPDHSYPNDFSNVTYNQIDLFYKMMSSVATLSNLPINRTDKPYKQFSAFLKPAYDSMINGTKNRLHQTFVAYIQSTEKVQIYMIIVEAVGFAILMVFMYFQIDKFLAKRKGILSIIKDFFEDHQKTISNYHFSVNNHFRSLFDRRFQSSIIKAIEKPPKQESGCPSQNINKRQKILVQNQQRCSQFVYLRILLITGELIVVSLFVAIVCYNLSKISYLKYFQSAGFNFLRYFPTGPMITMGALQKYYSLQHPSEKFFDASKYDDVLASMFLFSTFPYVGSTDAKSVFFQKKKNYFFGNPCTYNPAILVSAGLSVDKCLSISNGTFSQGVSAYLRYSQDLGSKYMRGQIDLTPAQVDQYVLSASYQTVFVLDAISAWISEFKSAIQGLHDASKTLGVIAIIAMICLHAFFNEFALRMLLGKEYNLIKQIYRYFVPQFILHQNKIVRQKFIIQGLIKR